MSINMKTSGTGPGRRHIQGSKIAKRLPSVKYSLLQYSKIENFSKKNFSKKLHTQKNGPSGAPGPASASPWRATAKKLKGGPFGEKNSGKSLAVPKKNWKGGPFGLAGYGMLRGKTGKTFLV